MQKQKWLLILKIGLTLAIMAGASLLVSCRAAGKPTVIINAPASGIQVQAGQEVRVQSTATDAQGIVRTDLLVNGDIVRSDKAPSPQTSFAVVQAWKPTAPGKHVIGILAYNKENVASNMAEISIEVQAAPGPAPTVAPAPLPTVPPAPAPTMVPLTAAPPPPPTADIPTPTPRRIEFQANATDAVVQGQIAANTSDRWMIKVMTGQNMSVQLTPTAGQAILVIWGADGTVLISDHAAAATWNGAIPLTQDYYIDVRAIDGNPASYTLQVIIPPVPPTPTAVPPACVNGAAFVADVTIPDGTIINPNETFNKVWRMQNRGNCEWQGGYNFVFMGGDALTNGQMVAVPNTPSGGIVDLAVSMTAPAAPGQYVSRWQIRAADGSFFGDQVDVKINVPNPTPPGCSGAPQISSFAATATTVQKGDSVTLAWGPITNADRAEITPDIGGIGTPGETKLHIKKTTTYTLRAYCGNTQAKREVTITVASPAPTPVPPVTRRSANGTWVGGKFSLELTEPAGCSGPECPVQGRLIEVTAGSPVIDDIEGTINIETGAISLILARPGAQENFTGTVHEDNRTMSGNLSHVGKLTLTKQ